MPGHQPPAPARFVSGRRTAWLVALVPILLALAVIALVPEGERETSALDTLPAGADSTLAVELADRLPEDDGQVAIVLWTAASGALDRAAQRISPGRPASCSRRRSGGEPTAGAAQGSRRSWWRRTARPRSSAIPVTSTSATDNIDKVEDAARAAARRRPRRRRRPGHRARRHPGRHRPGLRRRQPAPAALTAGVVALLLILTYRSPVLWLVPLDRGRHRRPVRRHRRHQRPRVTGVAWDESTIGILSVLVFGAGTDYALLLISRYRDELKREDSRHLAMARAVARTAEAVASSAITVVLGLLTLLLSAIPTTRGLGLACAVGVVIAATFALVVLPAALVLFGRWVFWPQVPHVGDTVLVDSDSSLWHRVGDAVARRPRTFVVGTVVALAVLASGTLSISTGLDPADQFLEKPEAISAAERLGESFPAGTSDPVQVVTRDDARAGARRRGGRRRRQLRADHDHRSTASRASTPYPTPTPAATPRRRSWSTSARPSPTSTTPTSAAATPSRSTPRTTPPRTGC